MLLEKVKHNGKVKLRVILICPQSAEFAVSSHAERVLLARQLDEMFDILELMAASEQRPETDAEYFVIEFTEAKGQRPIGAPLLCCHSPRLSQRL